MTIIKPRVIPAGSFIKGELSCPEFPTKVRIIKGIRFNPKVTLNSKTLYFIVVSNRFNYEPVAGFYDVPNKGYITWIGKFIPIAISHPLAIGAVHHIAYVFQAYEDTPPVGLTPFKAGNGGTAPGIIF